jgi:GTP cyclohydrolase II
LKEALTHFENKGFIVYEIAEDRTEKLLTKVKAVEEVKTVQEKKEIKKKK